MTQNIAHNNAPKGILITQDNLTRFNKRLHKAMQEEGLDISYSKAANIFAKACGKKNLHEITELFKELEVSQEKPMGANVIEQKSFVSIKEEQKILMGLKPQPKMPNVYRDEPIEIKNGTGLNLGDIAVLKNLPWAFEKVLEPWRNTSKVLFQFTADAPEGSFSFLILRLDDDKLKLDVIRYERFVQVNTNLDKIFNPVVDYLNCVLELRNLEEKHIFLNNWKKAWDLKSGFNYEVLTSSVFQDIKPIYMAGLYKQSFILMSQADFFNVKEKLLDDFSYKTDNGYKKSEIVNILNINNFDNCIIKTAPDLNSAIRMLESFNDEAFVFEVLEPLSAVNDKILTRFFISKTLKPFGFNQKDKFMITLSNYGNSSSVYELNNLSDISFFEGLLEKDFPLPSTPVNAPNLSEDNY